MGWVALGAGCVTASGTGPPPRGRAAVDARGWIVAPGLVDIHVHLREPGQTHKEDIATGSRAAAAGGFTTICCMPNTQPALDNAELVGQVRRRAEEVGCCRVHVVAAATRGRHGVEPVDFASLVRAGAVAFSDDGDGIEDDAVCRQVMRGVHACGSVLFPHCELKSLSKRGIVHLGPVSRRLGVQGYDPRGEEAMIERDLALVSETGCRCHIAHVSTARGIELVAEAKRRGLPVTTEVCPHHLLLCDEDVIGSDGLPDPNFKMSPPLRSVADRVACVEAVRSGVIDCIVTDHAPHTLAEKSAGFESAPMGVVGLETALPCAARALIGKADFGWPDLITRMSTNPTRVLGLAGGSLADGSPADLVVIDPERIWTVDPAAFYSRSRNTPFVGWQVQGRVMATLLGGRITHADPEAFGRLAPLMCPSSTRK